MMIVTGTFVEAIVSAIKMLWDKDNRKISYSVIASLAIGLLLALATDLDIMGYFGVVIKWKYLPQIISGIVVSRGANYVYDLVGSLSKSPTLG